MRRRAFVGLILPPGTHDDVDSQALRLAELFGHDLGDQPPIVAEQLRALRATDLTERLTELAGIPALVVNAANDPISPPLAGRRLHDGLIGSRYVEVPDASHGLPITHAAIVNQLLRNHFSAAASPGHSP
jgi:pimeloyl-ACP methyl ester carboxylesterase